MSVGQYSEDTDNNAVDFIFVDTIWNVGGRWTAAVRLDLRI